MIGSEILTLAYTLTNKDSSTFLDANSTNIYANLNRFYGHRVLDILRVSVDKNASINNATTTLVSTVGLVSGDNGYNGEYAFPTNLLRPTRFEISYDGLTWLKAEIYDNASNRESEYNADQLENQFSQDSPRVDFTRNSYKIRPPKNTAGNITNGIYIEYEQRQTDFASGTAPTQIESNLQDILAWDLAKLEMTMHASKYGQDEVRSFNVGFQDTENRFLDFYRIAIPTKQEMTFVIPMKK